MKYLLLTLSLAGCLLLPDLCSASAKPQPAATRPASRPAKAKDSPFFALHNGYMSDEYDTPDKQARLLKEIGYDGGSASDLKKVPALLRAFDEHGLELYVIYTPIRLDGNEPAYEPELPEIIKLLKGRKTMLWIYVLSKQHKASSDTGDERAVALLREVADMAAESDVQIALYPHIWFYVSIMEDGLRLIEKADRPNIGITFNLPHFLRQKKADQLETLLKKSAEHLKVVTLCGADYEGDWDRLIQTLDKGAFDIPHLLDLLREIDFVGPVGLQCYAIPGDKKEILTRSMAAWKRFTARSTSPTHLPTVRKKH